MPCTATKATPSIGRLLSAMHSNKGNSFHWKAHECHAQQQQRQLLPMDGSQVPFTATKATPSSGWFSSAKHKKKATPSNGWLWSAMHSNKGKAWLCRHLLCWAARDNCTKCILQVQALTVGLASTFPVSASVG